MPESVGGGLPPSIQSFLRDDVETLQQLELLIVLMNDPGRWWDAPAVARQIGVEISDARAGLERLASRNLLAITISSDVRYRFQPGTPALRETTDRVAETIRRNSLDVYRFVAGLRNRAVRDFADAFRIRRDDAR